MGNLALIRVGFLIVQHRTLYRTNTRNNIYFSVQVFILKFPKLPWSYLNSIRRGKYRIGTTKSKDYRICYIMVLNCNVGSTSFCPKN